MNKFLPMTQEDLQNRGWETLDFIVVTGDAYVDHPSYGAAIIGRTLERFGYKVGIIAQPDWKDNEAFKVLGKPRLGFLVTGGNIDSMVNHYSVSKKRRKTDAYSPGGEAGLRPDRASIVYSHKLREIYKKSPIILGGIEASLRRLAHYDYWDNAVRRSILLDSKADLVIYGMAEKSIVEVAEALESGIPVEEITFVRGTVFKTADKERVVDGIELPSYDDILDSKKKYAESFMIQYHNTDSVVAKPLIEPYRNLFVVQNPPQGPLSQEEMDSVFDLPYTKQYHPKYKAMGGIPAIEEVKFSLISNRGCYGGCSFCALTFHQGRVLQARSHESIVKEAEELTNDPDFKGYIHDVGGPTANFRHAACDKQTKAGVCTKRQCLHPTPCKKLKVDHDDYVKLLRKIRSIPKIKKVFVRSGIRYDYLMYDNKDTFFKELVEHHVSGQLKVAPEHVSPKVLQKMGKPNVELYNKFVKKYYAINDKLDKNQFLVPYLMSSHPGSDIEAAIELAEYLRDLGYMPEQVQDFYPTPGTLSTCMYYTGIDPRDNTPVYVAKTAEEKAMQRALIQYRKPENYEIVYKALQKANRQDLIGFGPLCLIKPRGAQRAMSTGTNREGKFQQGKTKGNTPSNKTPFGNHKTKNSNSKTTSNNSKTTNNNNKITSNNYKTTSSSNKSTNNNKTSATAKKSSIRSIQKKRKSK